MRICIVFSVAFSIPFLLTGFVAWSILYFQFLGQFNAEVDDCRVLARDLAAQCTVVMEEVLSSNAPDLRHAASHELARISGRYLHDLDHLEAAHAMTVRNTSILGACLICGMLAIVLFCITLGTNWTVKWLHTLITDCEKVASMQLDVLEVSTPPQRCSVLMCITR